jgi:hypothetical protein
MLFDYHKTIAAFEIRTASRSDADFYKGFFTFLHLSEGTPKSYSHHISAVIKSSEKMPVHKIVL